jgi:hypothetical protein
MNKDKIIAKQAELIDWLTSGRITSEEYDLINLKDLAEMIGKGHEPRITDFIKR